MKHIVETTTNGKFLCHLLTFAVIIGFSFSGCARTHRYSVEEARKNPGQQYDQAVVPSHISAVVLEVAKSSLADSSRDSSITLLKDRKSLDSLTQFQRVLLQFDANGGRIIRDSELIVGAKMGGGSVVLPFDSVIALQYRVFDRGLAQMTVREALAAQDAVRSRPGHKVSRDKYASWSLVDFDNSGGKIDTSLQRLVGTSRSGKQVSVPLEDVVTLATTASFFNQCSRHPYRVVRVGVVVTILALVCFGPIHHQF